MKEIQNLLGPRVDKLTWNAIRTFVRHRLRAAGLRWDLGWKAQDTYLLGIACRAINDEFPELKRFDVSWATYRIMKECWDNMKIYPTHVSNPETYIGRKAAERQRQHTPPPPGPSSQTPRPSHRATPLRTAGPSRLRASPARRRPRPLRAPSSSEDKGDENEDEDTDDENDDKDDNDDDEGDDMVQLTHGEDDDEEDQGKGKKRAGEQSGGASPKRRRM